MMGVGVGAEDLTGVGLTGLKALALKLELKLVPEFKLGLKFSNAELPAGYEEEVDVAKGSDGYVVGVNAPLFDS